MTADARKKLVKKLATPKRFDANYPAASRAWFVDRLARVFDDQGMSDADIETHVTDVMTKALALVKTKRAFKIGLPFGKAVAKINTGRYVEILYGAIATNPDFSDPANSDMLDFVARRRMRSVARMNWWVNPNSQGFFRYPDTCPTNERYRVNVDAQAYWESATSKALPITIKRPGGNTPDLVTAISKVFTAKKKPCDGNLLDCAATMRSVLMESLFEAKDRAKLLKKLDSVKADYLAIDQDFVAKNFMTDAGSEGLFTRDDRIVEDTEVGNYHYIFNHPLYKTFKPTGSWRGEHSLVFNAGDRDVHSKDGIVFGGHGMIGTVYKFYDKFLVELQTDLHRAYRIGAVFLYWLKSNKTAFPGKVTSSNRQMTLDGTPNVAYELDIFTVSFKFNNWMKPATKKGVAQTNETGFAIAYFPSKNRFYLARRKTEADVVADGVITNAAPFQRTATVGGDGEFDPINWGVTYQDLSTSTTKRYELYQKVGGKLTFTPLTIDDLFESPFFKDDPKKEEIFTVSPRIDFGASYKSFLTTNGGI